MRTCRLASGDGAEDAEREIQKQVVDFLKENSIQEELVNGVGASSGWRTSHVHVL